MTVPTAVATSIGEVGSHTATVGDAATADACITIYQATPAVASDTTGQSMPTGARPTTGMPLVTPEVVLALETPPHIQSATRPAQLTLPRLSPATPAGVPEGGGSGPASIPEPAPPPPRTGSPTLAERRQPREEVPEHCCVCYEALAAPVVHLGSYPHRLHLPTALCRTPRHGGGTPTLPGVPRDRNSRRS